MALACTRLHLMKSFVKTILTDLKPAHFPGLGALPGGLGKIPRRLVVNPVDSENSQVRSS
jgi:hypothetical protein